MFLALEGNPIPDDQKAMLRKALLNCDIKFWLNHPSASLYGSYFPLPARFWQVRRSKGRRRSLAVA